MTLDGVSMDHNGPDELADAVEEIRGLFELADEGVFDIGPAVRSLLTNAYFAAEDALEADAG
jgi:hypothetical protein